jgi:hypothetical protein
MALAATSPALAQLNAGHCGSDVKPEEVAPALLQEQSGMYRLTAQRQDTVVYHLVRVKMHIVRMSNHTGGVTRAAIWGSLIRANSELDGAHIFLVPQDDIDYIDDDNYYLNIATQAQLDALRTVRPQPNMLNIYFTQNLATETGGLCGQSSFTVSASQGIVMANSCITGDSVLSHEIGHYWDLYHTHETAFGAECVNESNCSTAGDLLCDTPADPNVYGLVTSSCQYVGSALDSCSHAAYSPNTHNTMSYTYFPCMNGFTPQQITKAEATLLNLRPSHVVANLDFHLATHLDTSSPTNGTGVWNDPVNSWLTALTVTASGSCIAIARAGENEGAITLNRKMVLYNSGPEGSVVRIGAP